MKKEIGQLTATPLLFAVGIIAICGIIYELMIGAISSYLLGNSVKQYSITIGLFMSAMGIGSYFTKYVKNNLFDNFILIEIIIGFFGGFSAILLFVAYAYSDSYHLVMYIIIIVIGIMVGIEIPLLTRIIEDSKNNLRMTIANVLSVDYIGALVGSLAFPLLLLPNLGEIRTSFLIGSLNLLVALVVIKYYSSYIKRKTLLSCITVFLLLISIVGVAIGDEIGTKIEDQLYRDKVIVSKQTQYQKIVVTQHKDDVRLYLDGNIQFSSLDEYRYHEALVHPAMKSLTLPEHVLILGGGDGLAIREVLKYNDVKSITLVDLDPGVVELCKTNPLIVNLNEGVLTNEKVNIIHMDAYTYLEETNKKFDVVFVDLPDPNNEALNKLYTTVFYRLINRTLTKNGVVAIQSTSPFYATDAYWCIRKTVAQEFAYSDGYHLYIPSFGDWGFTIASKVPINKDKKLSVKLRYLTDELVESMFIFGKDEMSDMEDIKINSLLNPVLFDYYQNAWKNM